MKKRDKIIYWVFTIWLAFGLTYTGIIQVLKTDIEVDLMNRLGYPIYVLTILGVWKILGALTVLVPKFPLLKEWAYAGIFFNMSGALVSHIMMGNGMIDIFPTLLFLAITAMSWYFRPATRTLIPMVDKQVI